jgi:dTDP-4-dehydrorhamnose reductase
VACCYYAAQPVFALELNGIAPANRCTDVYGKTKSLGEIRAPGCLTLRCSIVGPDPSGKSGGLFEWFRGQPEGKTVEGYTHHLWNGVTTPQLAELCRRIITADCFQTICAEASVHHFCPNLPVSKYELLHLFRAALQKHIAIIPVGEALVPVRRILATHYQSIKALFGTGCSMEQAVRDLMTWSPASP